MDSTTSRTSNRLSEYNSTYQPLDHSTMSPINIASPATAAHNTVTNTQYSYTEPSVYNSGDNIELLSVQSADAPMSPTSAVYFHNTDNEADDDTIVPFDSTDNADIQVSPHTAPSQQADSSVIEHNNNPAVARSIASDSNLAQHDTQHTDNSNTHDHTHLNGTAYNTANHTKQTISPNKSGDKFKHTTHITVQPRTTLADNLQITRWGEIRPKPKPPTPEQLQQRNIQLLVDRERENKWLVMLRGWDMWQRSRGDKIKSRVCKGVPDSLRGTVWPKLTEADKAMQRNSKLYDTYLAQQSVMDDVIMRDIHRTFPSNIFFKDTYSEDTHNDSIILRGKQGKTSLYNVLRAYSNYDRTVGYCQGMGFVAGLLLQYCNEQTTFYILRQIIQQPPYQLSGFYQPSFPLLNQYFYIFTELMRQRNTKLHSYFAELCIEPSFYSTQWFITLYSYNFPIEVTLRIWDILFSQGTKILFRTALYIITCIEAELLAAEYEQVIHILKNVHTHKCMQNVDQFIAGVLNVKLSSSTINKLAQQYGNMQLNSVNK